MFDPATNSTSGEVFPIIGRYTSKFLLKCEGANPFPSAATSAAVKTLPHHANSAIFPSKFCPPPVACAIVKVPSGVFELPAGEERSVTV